MGLALAVLLSGCTGDPQTVPALKPSNAPAGPDQPDSSPRAAHLTLEVGHCWVEYVRFQGRRWALQKGDQFGWGGGMPETFKGSGNAVAVDEEHLAFVDEGGTRLVLVPVNHRDAYRLEGRLCD